ncbi:unnamed protein product [Notodromas monacha]|uniref:Uncharacterized protein n=1 Tax=Notodromas monacha TaxID=399045 RepID=A0A7R9BIL7_9CRUS|nr:unnamed protein product [Notodromas monacha]CAG0915093.1 unnamed protein product [Notodromas monacha]
MGKIDSPIQLTPLNAGEGNPEPNQPVLKTRSGRICHLSKKVKQNLDSIRPIVKTDKRRRIKCVKCEERFVGIKNLWRHLVLNPDHGSLPDNGEQLDNVLNLAAKFPKESTKIRKPIAPPDPTVNKIRNFDSLEHFVNKKEAIPMDAYNCAVRACSPCAEPIPIKEEVRVETSKQAFLRKCQDLSLGELFVARTESNHNEAGSMSTLSSAYGRRFLAMLKDLEHLVDALKYAAELSFVLEERKLAEGVLEVKGTLSDILAIAEGYYKPVCDMKEIMQLVREKLKANTELHQSKFLLLNSKKPKKPLDLPPVKPSKGLKGPRLKKQSEKQEFLSPVDPERRFKTSVRVVDSKSLVKQTRAHEKNTKPQSLGQRRQQSVETAPSMPILSAASPVMQTPSQALELTIDAVIHTVGVANDQAPNVMMYCNDPNFVPCAKLEAASESSLQLPLFSDDAHVPTESLSPSLKLADESVTKDALSILSEDINEASNSSDIGSVLIPVSAKNEMPTFHPNGTTFNVDFEPMPVVSMSPDEFISPSQEGILLAKRHRTPSKNSFSVLKATNQKALKRDWRPKDDCNATTIASVFNGSKLLKQNMNELGRHPSPIVSSNASSRSVPEHCENLFLSLDSNYDNVPVEMFNSDPFLNPNFLTCQDVSEDSGMPRFLEPSSSPSRKRLHLSQQDESVCESKVQCVTSIPRMYQPTRSPDRFSIPPLHLLSPKYRMTLASGNTACTIVDSSQKPISQCISPQLFGMTYSPLPSPVQSKIQRKDGEESEIDDDERETDPHGVDSDLESVTNAYVEGRLVARPPDAHSDSSNCSVVDFEKLMRDIDIPVDLNYVPPAVTSEFSPMALPSPSSFQTPPRDPVFH